MVSPRSVENVTGRSSDNTGTSGLALKGITENSARTTLTEKQKVLERGAITEKPAPSSLDFTTSQEVLSESVRDSEIGNIWSNAGQLGPDPVGTNQVDGIPLLDSPMRDNFWYSFWSLCRLMLISVRLSLSIKDRREFQRLRTPY